jgi:putative SOS response-associated peptidase YedK
MCGRYAATLPPEMMVELFNLLNSIDYPPRYNIAPTQPIAAIWEQMGRRTVQLVRWGFVPTWVKDPREFSLLINARAESMLEKPSFRDAVRSQRCIIPADGYYEWMKTPDGGKQPYYITQASGQTMAFAGLYSQWAGPNGEEVDTALIVTVEPNLEVSSIYERMPAILHGAAIDGWLNTRDVDAAEAAAQCRTPPDGTMTYWPVSRTIGSATAEGPDLIRPLTEDEARAQRVPTPRPARRKVAGGGEQLDLF